MTTYVLRGGKLVEKRWARPRSDGPMVVGDLPGYLSPVCGPDGKHKYVDGRAARREDLKRNHCREYDPGEKRMVQERVAREKAEIRRDYQAIHEMARAAGFNDPGVK